MKKYPIDGKKRKLERVSNYTEFKKLLKNGEVIIGMLRLSRGHSLNVYKEGNTYYVSDVGNRSHHGLRLEQFLKDPKDFDYFEFIK